MNAASTETHLPPQLRTWVGRPINPAWYKLNANVPVAGSLRSYEHCLRTRAAPRWRASAQGAALGCVGQQNAGNLLHTANTRPKPRSHAPQRHQQPIQPFPIADLRRTEVGGHNECWTEDLPKTSSHFDLASHRDSVLDLRRPQARMHAMKAHTALDVAMIEARRIVIRYGSIIIAIVVVHQSGFLYREILFHQPFENLRDMICDSIHGHDLSLMEPPVEAEMVESYQPQSITPDRRSGMQDVPRLHVVAECRADGKHVRQAIREYLCGSVGKALYHTHHDKDREA